MKKYDIIVVGSGAAGLTCAIGAAKLNKKVLLIEEEKTGGECTWSGCVPSKAFINYSKTVKDNSIFQKTRAISEEIYTHESPELLESMNVNVLIGHADFKDAHTIVVNNEEYNAKIFVVATGARPGLPPIKGLENVDYLTNDNFFQLNEIPKEVVFIGAGFITMELSLPLTRIGTKVTIIEKAPSILHNEDEIISNKYLELIKEHNIELITSANIHHVEKQGDKTALTLDVHGSERTITMDKLFICSSRVPNTDTIKLENAGVEYTPQGITVNEYLQTNVPHIYALGDVVGPFRFSHVSGYAGEIFIRNLIMPFFKKKFHLENVPFTVFTEPEYSRCGDTLKVAEKKYGADNLKVYTYTHHQAERAIVSLDKHFHLTVICHKNLIVGAYCMSSRAGEIIALLQYMKDMRQPFACLAKGIQAYPTYGDTLRKLAKQAYIDYILSNPIIKLFRK